MSSVTQPLAAPLVEDENHCIAYRRTISFDVAYSSAYLYRDTRSAGAKLEDRHSLHPDKVRSAP
jgi:hypothetical protein